MENTPQRNGNNNPCYQCNHREVSGRHTCHSTCKLYIEWKTAWDAAKEKDKGNKLAIAYAAERKRSRRYYGR